MQTSNDFETTQPVRPTFLKVLCILTFIFSSYTILSQVYVYFQAEETSAAMTEAKSEINKDMNDKKADSPEEKSFLNKVMGGMSEMSTPESLRKQAIGNIIASALCLLGAILMWRLNRTGFYLYILGTVVGIVVPFYLFGNNFVTAISTGFASFIGLLFIIFYAMNLKSMRK